MLSDESNVFKDMKVMYKRSGLSDRYGGSIFSTFIIITLFILLVCYYQIKQQANEIKDDWANQRCSPNVLPFAGFINAPAGSSAFEYTASNFTGCINNVVKDVASNATMPITWMVSIATNTFKMMGEALQKVRGQVDILRNEIKQIIVKLYEKILRIIIPIQQLLITIIDLMGKLNGIFQTTIGQAEGAYHIMASSIGALHEFIVIILLALSALVIILWMIPITWGLAAGMTTIFILIMIPLIVIAVYMKAIFKLQGSGIPGVPSCFDENTKLKTNDNKNVSIKDIKLGTKLQDGSIITSKMKMAAKGHDMYKINNMIISGNHRIIDNKKLIPVKEHPESRKIRYNKPYIYCINTSSKYIMIDGYKFTDYDDLDNDEMHELKYMFSNKNLKPADLHKKYEGGFVKETEVQLYNGEKKSINQLEINDKLQNGEFVVGIIEIDGKEIDLYKYHLHNLEIIGGKNLYLYDLNLGNVHNISNTLLQEKINDKHEKLYSIVTNTGMFNLDNYTIYDYNGVLDAHLKKDHEKLLKTLLK